MIQIGELNIDSGDDQMVINHDRAKLTRWSTKIYTSLLTFCFYFTKYMIKLIVLINKLKADEWTLKSDFCKSIITKLLLKGINWHFFFV